MSDSATRVDLHVKVPHLQLAFETTSRIIALRGPSGCGKTTLLRAIAGLTPARGTLVLGGQEIDLASAPETRAIGYCPQDALLFPHLDVRANIAFGGAADSHVLIASLELTSLLTRMPAKLSGGEKQRVALARALARHARVLLLDEPFAAQHPEMRARIVECIRSESTERTVILTSHEESSLHALDAFMVQVPHTHA